MKNVNAIAHANIALVKYWGKRTGVDPELNLPAVGSLSLTLDGLWTQTAIRRSERDAFALDGQPTGGLPAERVWGQLDRLWRTGHEGPRPRCTVESINHFPTAAGLASSASGFAALTVAGDAAFELGLGPEIISGFARMGSGSAARSVFGGFVRLHRGERDDGSDCVAAPLPASDRHRIRLVVVQTARGPKSVTSTDGMEQSRQTSPYYAAWVDTSERDLATAERALREGDFTALGEVVEHSCFKMHACMMATRPPLLYWNATTVGVMQRVWEARAEGRIGYVTADAGPHVKVLCREEDARSIADRCALEPGVAAVSICGPGPAATASADLEDPAVSKRGEIRS